MYTSLAKWNFLTQPLPYVTLYHVFPKPSCPVQLTNYGMAQKIFFYIAILAQRWISYRNKSFDLQY